MITDYLIITGIALGVMLAAFEFAKAIVRMFSAKELADADVEL
jgi:hypothetical protein